MRIVLLSVSVSASVRLAEVRIVVIESIVRMRHCELFLFRIVVQEL